MRALLLFLGLVGASCTHGAGPGARAHGVVVVDELRVAALAPGRVALVTVQPGARVAKDQVLLTLDATALTHRRDELQAECARLAAELARLERGALPEELRELRAQCDELAARAKQSSGAERERLDAEFAAMQERFSIRSKGARREDLDAARAAVQAMQARLRGVTSEFANVELRAPMPALVQRVHTQAGENVGAGAVLVTLRDPARLYVEADLAPLSAGWQKGASVWITSSLLPSARFEGQVLELSVPPAPSDSTHPAFVRVRIDLFEGRDQLAPGSAVEVELAH
ncbi:MAG: efflux RND transporter periplasmic adaptor subunit [Planctomycetes bacterium]|nr:efflux RND transporter periplasmic adaptor subunit [Planctomycetota bacterium]